MSAPQWTEIKTHCSHLWISHMNSIILVFLNDPCIPALMDSELSSLDLHLLLLLVLKASVRLRGFYETVPPSGSGGTRKSQLKVLFLA